MKYEYNGKTLNIPDDFIQNAMKNLSIDEDEAIQLWLEDNDYEVNEEQMALDAKAKANVKVANIVKARAAEPSKKKTQRERVKKEDPTKEGVIAALAKALPELANAENVTIVNAGTQHNVIPDLCTFTIDVRSNELYSNHELFQLISKEIHGEVKARSFRLNSSHIPTHHPLVQSLISMGKVPFGSPTLSDQALMPFPSLKMGPGESSRSHTADEYIEITEIADAISTYTNLLQNISL